MKIMIVISFYYLPVITDLAINLSKKGHEIHLLFPKYDDSHKELLNNNIKIVYINIRSSLYSNNFLIKRIMDIRAIFKIIKYYKDNKIDVMHLNLFRAVILGRLCKLLYPKIVICSTIHGPMLENRYYYIMEKITSRLDDYTIFISRDVRNYCKDKNIKYKRERIIYNGLDLFKFKNIKKNEYKIKKYNNQILVGLVAWLYPNNIKGHEDFIFAINYILNKMKRTRYYFYIIGGDVYGGNYSEELKRLKNRLKIDNHLIFIGKQTHNNIANIINELDCIVVPSTIREGFGMVIIEALSMNKIVIGSNIGGIPEIIQNGYNGFLISPNNSKQLGKQILNIFENMGNEKIKNIRYNAGRTVVENFNLDIMSEEYEKVYKNII